MQKFAEQLERDIVMAAQIKLARMANVKTAGLGRPDPAAVALLGLLGAGAGGVGLGALGNIMASPEEMYDNGITASGLDLKPTPAYEGQEPVPWYRNPNSKMMGTIGGALGGIGLGGILGMNLGAALSR